jgi:hypothetical protein
MSPDSIPQISLGTAVLVIFAICASFVILRGMARMLLGTAVLAASVCVSYVVWQQAPAWSLQYLGKADAWLTTAAPIAAFIISFILLRWITKAIARPFGSGKADPKSSSTPLPLRLLFALVPTAIICLIAVTAIHHVGSIAELRALADEKTGGNARARADLSQRLKQSIESAIPESWLQKLDPFADPKRLAIAREITTQVRAPKAPVVDPATGQPIPRAIIVNEPELQNLAREGKFATLLRHPLLSQFLDDTKAPPR